MLPYKVTTSPVIKPLTIDATLRQHLRISSGDTSEDTLVGLYIDSITEEIERYIGYPLMTQEIEVKVGDTILEVQELTGNVLDVVSYTYINSSDVLTTVTGATATGLQVDKYGLLSYVNNEDWPTGTDFRIKCNAGYTVANIPADLLDACRLLLMHRFEVRGPSQSGMPDTVEYILDRHLLY